MRVHIIDFTKWIFVIALAICIVLYYTASSNLQFQELVQLLTSNSQAQTDPHASSNQSTLAHDAESGSSITGLCQEVQFPFHLVGSEKKWQDIGTGKNMFVFSAYYIEKPSTVYVIGIKSRRDDEMICQLWWLDGDVFVMGQETQATIPLWLDDSGLRYSPTVFECFVTSPGVPYYVSLAINGCEDPLNMLKVENITPLASYVHEFTVCPDPISITNTADRDLIQWIETNRLLGAELFIIYVVSTTPGTRAILDHYVNQGLVELVGWDLPVAVEDSPENAQPKEIARFARVAAMNECLFRNKRQSRFVLNIDTNEYVFPQDYDMSNWADLIEQLDQSASSYCLVQGVVTSNNTHADSNGRTNSTVCKEYSKHFLRTAAATFTLPSHAPGINTQRVPTRLGIIHRQTCSSRNKRAKVYGVDDVLLDNFQYRHILIRNVQDVWDAVHIEQENEQTPDGGLNEVA